MASERRPAILAVDDEPAVLAAVARALRRGVGGRYPLQRAGSGGEALVGLCAELESLAASGDCTRFDRMRGEFERVSAQVLADVQTILRSHATEH